jgi:hypothetical protein
MRGDPAMELRIAFVIVLWLLGLSGISHAQNWSDWKRDDDRRDDRDNRDSNQDVTEVQKRACQPDVFRLCSWYIPNRDAITTCLHSNIDKLNADCRAVMEGRLR